MNYLRPPDGQKPFIGGTAGGPTGVGSPPMELTPAEGRVLGCLIDKQVDGPAAYSLTLNELRYACNQTSGREPVVTYDDRTIEETLTSLKSKGLARFVPATPSVRKPNPVRCRHRADDRWRLNSTQLAVLAVLLLRGPQTVEEVQTLVSGHSLLETHSEVEATLDSLAGRTPKPFATRLRPVSADDRGDARPPVTSYSEVRWTEVLTGWPDDSELLREPPPTDPVEMAAPPTSRRTGPEPVSTSASRPTTYDPPALPLYAPPTDPPPPAAAPQGPSAMTPSRPIAPPPGQAPSPLTMVELADRLSGIERRLAGLEAALGALRKAVEDQAPQAPVAEQPTSRLRM